MAPDARLTLSKPSAVVGGFIQVTGSGFAPGSVVELWLHSEPVHLGTVTSGSTGAFTATLAIPRGAPLGAHRLVAVGETLSGPIEVDTPIMVGLDLPATDMSADEPAPVSAALFLLGAIAFLLTCAAGRPAARRSGRRPA